ncbi:hypothetical protein [Solemya velesiana gill symbiont]|uniref:Uncharacterized protein n=1 Tax=Solemya velesiana gill symbiont TaxID=1918948 RepID=A0A1T2KT09_9GAMM|nr:hypothetical protein [Solemya velesiana gill symbiont]OOZ35989.1 hypothetical protein BOW51_09330 [Solemya velesiana gill symbiont]
MEQNVIRLIAMTGLLASGSAMAHVGAHGGEGFLAGVLHMLGDHGYLLGLAALAIGAVVFKRSHRV